MTPQQDNQARYTNFPFYTNYAAFDPNSAAATQLMMPNNRNMNSTVRLLAPMLINVNGNQNFTPSSSLSSTAGNVFNQNSSFNGLNNHQNGQFGYSGYLSSRVE